MIKEIHFNKDHPENQNIKLNSIKNQYMKLYKDGSWQDAHKNELIVDLLETNALNLSDAYNNNIEHFENTSPITINAIEKSLQSILDDDDDDDTENNNNKKIKKALIKEITLIICNETSKLRKR